MTLGAARSELSRSGSGATSSPRDSLAGAPPSGGANAIAAAFRAARESGELVVLEGFHPLKHALRFGAHVDLVVTHDPEGLLCLARDHAPELEGRIMGLVAVLTRKDFRRLGPYEPHTGVVAIAPRVDYDANAVLADPAGAPIVLLDEPRHRGNFGAVIRVGAAAGATGVLNTGSLEPWHPVVVRGAAGLQFALPVARIDRLPDRVGERTLLVFDPAGDPLAPGSIPPRAILAFGSERQGVGQDLIERADGRLRLPMREGVSSLNLATAVAAVLYGAGLGSPGQG
jgi:RNA methyltransferase, TrmH family